MQKRTCCIADGCGMPYDLTEYVGHPHDPAFGHLYCPVCRKARRDPNRVAIVNVPPSANP